MSCVYIQRSTTHESDSKQVVLWVEMLEKYIYFFEAQVEEVAVNFIDNLLNMCNEHIAYAEQEGSSSREVAVAKLHVKNIVEYLRHQQQSSDSGVAARFAA